MQHLFSFATRTPRRMLRSAALLCCLAAAQAALAQTASASAQYQEDLKLCAEEKDANARLQCRRDARTVYDKALAAEKAAKAKAAAPASTPAAAPGAPRQQPPPWHRGPTPPVPIADA